MSLKKVSRLLVVAHPDDETLFFGGLLQSRSGWKVVCVTDGNADGVGAQRKQEVLQACKLLKVADIQILNFQDVFERRLDTAALISELKAMGSFKEVFTHSILGEYGHPHHQDVSYAVHKAFAPKIPVFSVAYNALPTLKINLTPKQYGLKTKILSQLYAGEIKRLIHFLPAHSQEGFIKVSLGEVESLYQRFANRIPLDAKAVKIHKWLIPYFEEGGGVLIERPF